MKKVLWITSYFPPRVTVATIRTIKFLKYLPQFGWQAAVICPTEATSATPTSQKLLAQLSQSVRVIRTRPDPFLDYTNIRRYLGFLISQIIPPDSNIVWALLSLPLIARQISEYQPDLVFTTCPPFSLNLIGAWLKHRYGLPWITDFRDLWTFNPLLYRRSIRRYHQFISGFQEQFYMKRCDGLVTTTPNSYQRMNVRYPFLKEKNWVIPNGFDREEIQEETSQKPDTLPHSLFYGGDIDPHSNYGPRPILELLARLAGSGQLGSSWKLHYAGSRSEAFTTMVGQAGLPFDCQIYGYMDQSSYYQLIRQMAHVLFCLPPDLDTQSWLPARLYDYLGNKSRIIALVPRESEAAGLLNSYGQALTLFYEESADSQLQKLNTYLSVQHTKPDVPDAWLNRFSRIELTRQLAQVFDRVTAESRQGELS